MLALWRSYYSQTVTTKKLKGTQSADTQGESGESLFGFCKYEAISLPVMFIKLKLQRPTEDQTVNICFSVALHLETRT